MNFIIFGVGVTAVNLDISSAFRFPAGQRRFLRVARGGHGPFDNVRDKITPTILGVCAV